MSVIHKVKINKQFYTTSVMILIFIHILFHSNAQSLKTSVYSVKYIKSEKSFKQTIKADSNKKMMELKTFIPDLQYDLKYAGSNNFVKQPLYSKTTSIT